MSIKHYIFIAVLLSAVVLSVMRSFDYIHRVDVMWRETNYNTIWRKESEAQVKENTEAIKYLKGWDRVFMKRVIGEDEWVMLLMCDDGVVREDDCPVLLYPGTNDIEEGAGTEDMKSHFEDVIK